MHDIFCSSAMSQFYYVVLVLIEVTYCSVPAMRCSVMGRPTICFIQKDRQTTLGGTLDIEINYNEIQSCREAVCSIVCMPVV